MGTWRRQLRFRAPGLLSIIADREFSSGFLDSRFLGNDGPSAPRLAPSRQWPTPGRHSPAFAGAGSASTGRHSRVIPRHSRESGNPFRLIPSGAPGFEVLEVRRTAKRPLHNAYMANTSPPGAPYRKPKHDPIPRAWQGLHAARDPRGRCRGASPSRVWHGHGPLARRAPFCYLSRPEGDAERA